MGSPAAAAATPSPQLSRRAASIDRFDGTAASASDGEQIRTPLIKAPTTLAPAASGQAQAATQQDSAYMSPEERNELMRSQESHYEGKAGGTPVGGSVGQEQQQLDAPQYQQPQGGGGALQTDASGVPGSGGDDDDDEDYEGASRESPQTLSNSERNSLAPENRRMTSGGGDYRDRQHDDGAELGPAPVPDMASANEDESPQDGYGPPNDEAYFSRRKAAVAGSLNPAASYNRDDRNYGRAGLAAAPRSDRNYRGNDAGPLAAEEGQGFGPGPNEAEQLEAANANDDSGHGDESADLDPESGGGGGYEPDARLDRRLANEMPLLGAEGTPDSSDGVDPAEGGAQTDGGDSGEMAASGSSVSAAGSAARKSPGRGGALNPSSDRKAAIAQRRQQVAEQWMREQQLQQHLASNTLRHRGGGPNLAPAATSQTFSARQQPRATTTSAPYNPQNNPSHAGKYFIN